jgi:alginate O-acetyltransferase complex protein AlgI
MAFFPTIMEGPICRYGDTAEALYEGRDITYRNAAHGTQRMIWGLFKKLVVADRLAPLVMVIFDGYIPRPGGAVDLFGAACYTLQLYADFSGCVDISIGTAEIFGITLPENFRQPFFAPNASEFWRRWHITLGTWLRDYVFYPMCLKKYIQNIGRKARKRFGMHSRTGHPDGHPAVRGVDMQRAVAWYRMALYILRNVLFCDNQSGERGRAGDTRVYGA